MADFLADMQKQADAKKKELDAAWDALEAAKVKHRKGFSDDAARRKSLNAVIKAREAYDEVNVQYHSLVTTKATMAGKKNY